jgi:hypothetical protein
MALSLGKGFPGHHTRGIGVAGAGTGREHPGIAALPAKNSGHHLGLVDFFLAFPIYMIYINIKYII